MGVLPPVEWEAQSLQTYLLVEMCPHHQQRERENFDDGETLNPQQWEEYLSEPCGIAAWIRLSVSLDLISNTSPFREKREIHNREKLQHRCEITAAPNFWPSNLIDLITQPLYSISQRVNDVPHAFECRYDSLAYWTIQLSKGISTGDLTLTLTLILTLTLTLTVILILTLNLNLILNPTLKLALTFIPHRHSV